MTSNPDTYAIVFQMGKVASTAITKAFDRLEGVSAEQCHFMGEEALVQVLKLAIKPANSDYFFKHQLGQLTQNARITRRLMRLRNGAEEGRLVVLSLTRDPFDWFRSSVIQDIEGYAPVLKVLDPGGPSGDPDAVIQRGMVHLLDQMGDALEAVDTVEAFFDGVRRNLPCLAPHLKGWSHGQRHMVMSGLRPTEWLQQHLDMGLGLGLDDFKRSGRVWRHAEGENRFGIIRYEDLQEAFPQFCGWALGIVPPLRAANESWSKNHAGAVNAAFASSAGDRVRTALKRSVYARRFGYDGVDDNAPLKAVV